MSEPKPQLRTALQKFSHFLYELITLTSSLFILAIIVYSFMGDGYTTADMKNELQKDISSQACQYYVRVTEYWPGENQPDYRVRREGPFRNEDLCLDAAAQEESLYSTVDPLSSTLDSVRIDIQLDCYRSFKITPYTAITINTCTECNR